MRQGIAPLHWRQWMQGLRRRIVHTLVFELIAIALVTLAFMLLVQADAQRSSLLAALCSGVAMAWNMAYNSLFERWEARQVDRGRSLLRRAAHAIGFEGGLVLLLVPVIAWWLGIGLWQALVLDIGLSVFFLFYAFAFNWGFDHLFGLPGRPVETRTGLPQGG